MLIGAVITPLLLELQQNAGVRCADSFTEGETTNSCLLMGSIEIAQATGPARVYTTLRSKAIDQVPLTLILPSVNTVLHDQMLL
jgi:hypothetical protein